MMYSISRHIKSALAALMMTATAIPVLTSCNAVYEDLSPCPEGAALRFVYEYNMEYANGFPKQVTCLTVLVYDEQGNYIKTLTETSSVLADEFWRMKIDLPAGKYKFIAYGGMACEEASFQFDTAPGPSVPMTDVKVGIKPGLVNIDPGKSLHHLFYGALDLEIDPEATDYTPGTVEMMKDTNVLRILLHNADGSLVNVDDFIFTITDNNTLFNYDNELLPSPEVTYRPYYKENVGGTDDSARGEGDASFAVAELATSRFVTNSNANLTIKQISTGRNVLDIPLVKYLLYYKFYNEDKLPKMKNQEFLDRKSSWVMSLFLDPDPWGSVTIKIEDWEVRINDIDDF